jgi:hypothetical protein
MIENFIACAPRPVRHCLPETELTGQIVRKFKDFGRVALMGGLGDQ